MDFEWSYGVLMVKGRVCHSAIRELSERAMLTLGLNPADTRQRDELINALSPFFKSALQFAADSVVDPRVGRYVVYKSEDSEYAGRVAGVVRKFDRETGEHTGPERFVVQDTRGLLIIKGPKEV